MKIDNNIIKMRHESTNSSSYSFVLPYTDADIENIFYNTPDPKNKYNETVIIHYLTIHATGAI